MEGPEQGGHGAGWVVPTLLRKDAAPRRLEGPLGLGQRRPDVHLGAVRLVAVRRHVRHRSRLGTRDRQTDARRPGSESAPRLAASRTLDLRRTKPVRALRVADRRIATMGAYIIRRSIAMVGMLIALSMIVFLLFAVLPADPARLTCGKSCTPADHQGQPTPARLRQAARRAVRRLRQGHLRRPHLRRRHGRLRVPRALPGLLVPRRRACHRPDQGPLPVTAQLAIGGFIIWIVVGISVGIVAALKRGKWQDRTIMGVALVGYSFPSFFIGLAAGLLRQDQVADPPGPRRLRVAVLREPVGLVPDDDPAVDRARDALRGVLHPGSPATRCSRRWARTTSGRPAPRACRSARSSASTRCGPA